MRKFFSFRPKMFLAVLFTGAVLLAPWASHGCDARGASLQKESPAAGAQLPVDRLTASAAKRPSSG